MQVHGWGEYVGNERLTTTWNASPAVSAPFEAPISTRETSRAQALRQQPVGASGWVRIEQLAASQLGTVLNNACVQQEWRGQMEECVLQLRAFGR